MTPLVILGSGGFGRELTQWIQHINETRPTFEVRGFLDDHATESRIPEVPILGPLDRARTLGEVRFVLGIADPATKQRVVERLALPRHLWADILHPSAVLGARRSQGCGLILGPWSSLSIDTVVGDHVMLDCRAMAAHDVIVGNYCTLAPQALALGNVRLGDRVSLGASSVVLPGTQIGNDVKVGPLTTAMRRVPDGVTLFGSPGRRL